MVGDVENVTFNRDQVRSRLEQLRLEDEERTRQRRENRPKGTISDSLHERLRACNIPQLRTVKKCCDSLIENHKKPPEVQECKPKHVIQVLLSVTVRNKRFMLEFRRNSFRAERLYVNGPYVCAYWLDGHFIKKQNYSKIKEKYLPRKVRVAFNAYKANTDVEKQRQLLQEKLDASSKH